jgi:hypothetical protein
MVWGMFTRVSKEYTDISVAEFYKYLFLSSYTMCTIHNVFDFMILTLLGKLD